MTVVELQDITFGWRREQPLLAISSFVVLVSEAVLGVSLVATAVSVAPATPQELSWDDLMPAVSAPPPPNQIVYVKLQKPFNLKSMGDPYWVTGVISTKPWTGEMADTDYVMAGDKVEIFEWKD